MSHLTQAAVPTRADTIAARSFAEDEALLGSVLTEVIRAGEGEHALELHDRAVALAQRARAGAAEAADELGRLVAGLSLERAEVLIRSLTRWLQLVNLAEDNERIRRLRRRAAREGARHQGTLLHAVGRLSARGTSAEELAHVLAAAELSLVLTAHPTEARRRTTIEKLTRIFAVLRQLDERLPGARDEAAARLELAAIVQELWGSDEVRAVSVTVADEVQGGLDHFTTTIARVLPQLYRDLEAAIATTYPGADVPVPALLTFGTWMGGDRDGNPNVTPAATEAALDAMRAACLRFLEARVDGLAARISLSSRVTGVPAELEAMTAAAAERFPERAAELERRHRQEPYRRAFALVRERLRATPAAAPGGYAGPDQLLADLRVAERALQGPHGAYVAAAELRDVIRQVEVFGFHFARLDVREHAKVHRRALAEILSVLGLHEGYETLGDEERAALLAREIADRRPVIPTDLSGFSPATRQAVETFRTLKRLLAGAHAGAVRSYIISGAGSAADVLEVLLLMKEAGLARAGGEDAALRVVPLFESGETLRGAGETMRLLLGQPVYRAALRAVGDEQEVMIGYSDSNKDVGYVASGWDTYRAQVEVADALREHGIAWIFFHGRGGAVGRGGGPANVSILAQPPGTVAGRMKVTEQGEVLAAKFSVPEVAHRELELTASAVLLSTLERRDLPGPERLAGFEAAMEEMAQRSSRAYRDLVYGDPGFPAFFRAATPVEEISRLRLGSRPARRGDVEGIEDFRAIPWVFSWTQSRIVLPAWYGLGTALEAAIEAHGLELLREMRAEWPFFGALLSNAEMACAKADLGIGRRYAELCEDEELRERVWARIAGEFQRTTEQLMRVNGEGHLLDREPVLRDSIDRRNPYVDPLSYVQVDLLRRSRAGHGGAALALASLHAVNGIASGLRNTG